MDKRLKYPIGQQNFRNLREQGCVYVDKTRYIRMLVESGTQYYFLARPRRFGKSLFLSTLRYFFEGERELFRGLDVEREEWGWKWDRYPVLHFDLNTERYDKAEDLDEVLDRLLGEWETAYGLDRKSENPSQRFASVLKSIHETTGRQVIVMVDEYDKPLVSNMNDRREFEAMCLKLAAVYSNFKSGAEHIRMVFLTGVSRFSKLSVFSDLNNLDDITFSNDFSDICGITEEELTGALREGIERLSAVSGIGFHETCDALRENYDGYRFSENGCHIYNPWSVLKALKESAIGNYWNETGLPTVVAESLKRIHADLERTFDSYCRIDDLKGLDLLTPDPTALMYQTGYLTIKESLPALKRVRLGIPNNEVKAGLYGMLLPYYVQTKRNNARKVVDDIITEFNLGRPDKAMECLQVFFAGIDYGMRIDDENNFHNAFFLLIHLIGMETTAESHTSDGRIDILIETQDYIYIIELKYDHPAETALQQIDDKRYTLRFKRDGRRIFKIGASFSSETRRIDSWLIEEEK